MNFDNYIVPANDNAQARMHVTARCAVLLRRLISLRGIS
jgi:hypothetical protein